MHNKKNNRLKSPLIKIFSLISFIFFISLIMILFDVRLWAQKADFSDKIRLQFWAELDAYPESKEAADTSAPPFQYPITRLKEVAPYLINGLVYGYHFEYTPGDKARGVKEEFTAKPLGSISDTAGFVTYKSPISQDNYIRVWVEYEKTPEERLSTKAWGSVKNKKISGHGKGKISNGFDGIAECLLDAMKDAVREHFRLISKNKPREITGDLLIKSDPILGINSGYYVISLDFFLDNGIITSY